MYKSKYVKREFIIFINFIIFEKNINDLIIIFCKIYIYFKL